MSTISTPARRRRWPWILGTAAIAGALAAWWWLASGKGNDAQAAKKGPGAIPVVTTRAESRDVPVKIQANGTVTALQSVELRAQVTSTVREVHIREGQNVRQGDLLFSLDARTEEANLKKAQAQLEKDRADLVSSERNLSRQRELFTQKFISQAALDTANSQAESLRAQLNVNQAALEATRVQRQFMEIRAPFAGRTGAITVRPGSLVQPNGTVLVTIAQIDPITVSFTVPEKELAALQRAMSAGALPVTAEVSGDRFTGKLTFIDNSVETATGTIRVKAEFTNANARLWPGMYVNISMAPRTLANATVIPAQAIQTGPESRFVFIVGEDRKVASRPVKLDYLEEGFAVVDGLPAGTRVVIEGAQNLRAGSTVAEADRSNPGNAPGGEGKGKKGKGKGAGKGDA